MVAILHQPDLGLHRPAIKRVPYEVLSEIFVFYVESPQQPPNVCTYTLTVKPVAPSTLLFLGAVCVPWRNVAWTTPRLWTTVAFKISGINNNLMTLLDLVKQWLQRAGRELPLFIKVICRDSHRSLPFIKLLKEYRHRWQKMDFRCDAPYVLELLLRKDTDTYTSNLKVVHFTGHLTEDHAGPVALDLTADSPEEIYGFVPLSWIKTQWHALRSICLMNPLPVDHLLHVLSDAPALTYCNVNLDFIEEINVEVRPLVHNKLRDLRLRLHIDPEDDGSEQTVILEELLSNLASPSLTKLSVTFDEELNVNFDATYADTLMDFLARSKCSLKTFKQHGVIFSSEHEENQLLAVLITTPTLEHLKITTDIRESDKSISNHFLERLSVQTGDPDLLPNLKHFTYHGPLGFSEEALAKITCDDMASTSTDGSTGSDDLGTSISKPRLMERIDVELNDGFDEEGNDVHGQCPPRVGSAWKKITISI